MGRYRLQLKDVATHWHAPIAVNADVEAQVAPRVGSLSKVRCSLATGQLITPNINLRSHDVTNGLCCRSLSPPRFSLNISVFRVFFPPFISFSFSPFIFSFILLFLSPLLGSFLFLLSVGF